MTFTGPPLTEPVLVLGRAWVTVAASAARIVVKLPKRAMLAAAAASAHKHHLTIKGTLVISTKQPQGAAKLTRGALTIKS